MGNMKRIDPPTPEPEESEPTGYQLPAYVATVARLADDWDDRGLLTAEVRDGLKDALSQIAVLGIQDVLHGISRIEAVMMEEVAKREEAERAKVKLILPENVPSLDVMRKERDGL